jgi:RNase P protein component
MLERTPALYLEQIKRRNASRRNALTTRFRTAWKLGVEGIVTAAQVIVEAKQQLEHGQFQRLQHTARMALPTVRREIRPPASIAAHVRQTATPLRRRAAR